MIKEISVILLITIIGCKPNISENAYLRTVSENLDQIKSASYFSVGVASAPGDTAKFSEPRELYYKIFINPSDTLVGSSSATFSAEDTTKMTDFYDGNVRGKVNWDEQFVKIDSFKNQVNEILLTYNVDPSLVAGIPDFEKKNERMLSLIHSQVVGLIS